MESNWNPYRYYFDKLYPMGIMAQFEPRKDQFESDNWNTDKLVIYETNEIFRYNVKNHSDSNRYAWNAIAHKKHPHEPISYKNTFTDYLIREWNPKNQYLKLLRDTIEAYKKLSNYFISNLSQKVDETPTEDFRRHAEEVFFEIDQSGNDYFELVNEGWKRSKNLPMFIIKSKVPEGILSRFTKEENDNEQEIYIDIYAVPQIHNGRLRGFQNVVPEVNERRMIFLKEKEKIRKSQERTHLMEILNETNRAHVHSIKNTLHGLFKLMTSDHPNDKIFAPIQLGILRFNYDWLNLLSPGKKVLPEAMEKEIGFSAEAFFNSILFYALLVANPNMKYYSLDLIKAWNKEVIRHVSSCISANSISREIFDLQEKVANLWENFLAKGAPVNWEKIKFQGPLKSPKLVFSGHKDGIPKYNYYTAFQAFYEIFLNHVEHSKESAQYLYVFEEMLIISSQELVFQNNGLFLDEEDITHGSELRLRDPEVYSRNSSKKGLQSIKKSLNDLGLQYNIFLGEVRGNKEIIIQRIEIITKTPRMRWE